MELVAEVDDDDVPVLPFLLPLLLLALDDSAPLPPLEDEAGEPPPLLFTEGLMVVNVGSMKMSKGQGKGRADGHSKCVALGEAVSAKFSSSNPLSCLNCL